MENYNPIKKELTEKEEAEKEIVKNLLAKKAEIEEKFNIVAEKLERLKAEADKLFHTPKKFQH
jgi:peptidoglycan hydrolase CwlO-like protein